LSKKAVVHIADNVVDKESHRWPANVFKEGMFGCHAECRREAVESLEIATSPVASDAHGNGGPVVATLANVLGAK